MLGQAMQYHGQDLYNNMQMEQQTLPVPSLPVPSLPSDNLIDLTFLRDRTKEALAESR